MRSVARACTMTSLDSFFGIMRRIWPSCGDKVATEALGHVKPLPMPFTFTVGFTGGSFVVFVRQAVHLHKAVHQ